MRDWTKLASQVNVDKVVYNLDHKDRQKINNRIDNLRRATNSQQQANTAGKLNICGARGVYWHKAGAKYYAQIKINGKSKHLGFFDSVVAHFGEFANV